MPNGNWGNVHNLRPYHKQPGVGLPTFAVAFGRYIVLRFGPYWRLWLFGYLFLGAGYGWSVAEGVEHGPDHKHPRL